MRQNQIKTVYLQHFRKNGMLIAVLSLVRPVSLSIILILSLFRPYFIHSNQFTTMGRPPVLPKKKKDGFYIEIRNKGAKSGTIIIRDSEKAMMLAARQYETTKDVIILGEHRSGKRVDESRKKVKMS
jgi:hypothetical protein